MNVNDNVSDGDRRMRIHRTTRTLGLGLFVLLGGCAVGPDYVRPRVDAPAAFKELDGWKTAAPRDGEIRGNWWEVFGDPVLNSLEERIGTSNQDLARAEAQHRQAKAAIRAARAGFFPVITGGVSKARTKAPDSRVTTTRSSSATTTVDPVTTDTLKLDASWEADVWGRVRREVESNEAAADAGAADVETTRLSLQATLAQIYFQLRATETQMTLYEDTIAAYQKTYQLAENQHAAGIVSRVDVAQAQTQLKAAQAQATDLAIQRAQLEHALASLVGEPASTFALAPAHKPDAAVPAVPVGLPSDLLERRPDVAAAERRVAAANAQIGVAKTAYFPAFAISASSGYERQGAVDWLTAPNRFWSLGAALAQTLFSGGLRQAQTDQATAAYDVGVATYRQTVINAFKEVEDNLATLRLLEQEALIQNEASTSAHEAATITINQYKAGIVSYVNVVIAQTAVLTNERAQADIRSRQLVASVQLVKALGGGWASAAGRPKTATK
jgi:NodT family efflux transporter outer membrane factor (OMF) lipoprotein